MDSFRKYSLLTSFHLYTFATEIETKQYIMAKKNQLTTSDYLEYEEYERLLSCLHTYGKYIWELYARLSFCTACRASDVLQFHWKDVLDVNSCTVTEQKTKKTRTIPFNKSVQKKIRELYELLGSPDKNEFVFKSKVTGEPITIQCVNKRLKDFKYDYKLVTSPRIHSVKLSDDMFTKRTIVVQRVLYY